MNCGDMIDVRMIKWMELLAKLFHAAATGKSIQMRGSILCGNNLVLRIPQRLIGRISKVLLSCVLLQAEDRIEYD